MDAPLAVASISARSGPRSIGMVRRLAAMEAALAPAVTSILKVVLVVGLAFVGALALAAASQMA